MPFSGAHYDVLPFGMPPALFHFGAFWAPEVPGSENLSFVAADLQQNGANALSVHLEGETLRRIQQTASLRSRACR